MVAPGLETFPSRTVTSPVGELALRVCNAGRHGQVVRLKSTKCMIGSASDCTLRLRARGVAPIHCMILRGPNGVIVRRWSPDTLLNEQAFTDALLSPGDRLSIGPIELEVLSTGQDSQGLEAAFDADLPTAGDVRRAATGPSAIEPGFEDERTRLQEDRFRFDEECRRWDAERQQTSSQSVAENESISTRVAELDAQRAALDEERRQWEAERQQSASQVTVESESLAARTVELDAQRDALDEERRRWEAERQQNILHAATESESLAARAAELDAQRHALDEERRRWEAERQQTTSQTVAETESVNARAAELEAQREAFEQQQRQSLVEREQTEQRLNNRNEELNARFTTLNAQAEALDARTSELDRQRSELAERSADLEAKWSEFHARTADIEARAAEIEARASETDARAAQVEAERAALEEDRSRLEQRIEALRESPAPARDIVTTDEAKEPAFEEPSEQPPVSVADVLHRVGANFDLSDDEPPRTSPAADESGTTAARLQDAHAAITPDSPSIFEQRTSPRNETEEPEESIDEYMSRLMKRLRPTTEGEGAAAPTTPKREPHRPAQNELPTAAPVAAPAQAVPAQAVSEPAVASLAAPLQPPEPVEMTPRSQAPETHVNLSAFRDLANLSAASALNQHSRSVLRRTIFSKLLVAIIAAACGGVLLWMWYFFKLSTTHTFYAVIVALVVAVFWGVEYALLTGRWMVGKSFRFPWKPVGKSKPTSSSDTTDAARHAHESELPRHGAR